MDEAERCHRLAILDHGRKVADGSPAELQNSTGMSIVEVLAENPFAAQVELNQLPEVMSVTQLGVKLRVLIPDKVAHPLQLVEKILSANAIPAQTKLVDASLEDVFVAVTQQDDATEQAA